MLHYKRIDKALSRCFVTYFIPYIVTKEIVLLKKLSID